MTLPDLEGVALPPSEVDQLKSFCADLATIMVTYRKTLIRGGFPKKMAATMADDLHVELVERVFAKKGKRSKP